jgi:LPXTG-motif cell wall-anchored protein
VPPTDGGTTGPGKQHRVVVCKYVRKPGATEVYSHPIIVDFHALLGQGFAGSFPYAFSDGQLGSVAIRWAEPGERARDVADSECPTSSAASPELPPGTGTASPAGGEVAGIEQAEITPVRDSQEVATATRGTALPQTGAPASLVLLTVGGGLLVGGGAALATGAVRRRVVS